MIGRFKRDETTIDQPRQNQVEIIFVWNIHDRVREGSGNTVNSQRSMGFPMLMGDIAPNIPELVVMVNVGIALEF